MDSLLLLLHVPESLFLIFLQYLDLVLTLRHLKSSLKNIKSGAVVLISPDLSGHCLHLPVLTGDLFQLADLTAGVLDLLAHPSVFHDALLHVLDVDILLRADIFFHKFFQLDVHAERNSPLKQKRKFLRIQAAQIDVIKLFSKPLVVGTEVKFFFGKGVPKPLLHLLRRHGTAHGSASSPLFSHLFYPVLMVRYRAPVPEKHPGDLIGIGLHIEDHADTLTLSRVGPLKLQDDGAGKITVPQVGEMIVLPDIYHASEILDQSPVRVVGSCFVKKASAVGVGIEHNLHGINDRGFAASRMSRKKIDAFMEGQSPVPDIMPVVQADPGQSFKPLIRHLPRLLPCMSL